MDIKHVLSSTVVKSPYRGRPTPFESANPAWSWIDLDGGTVQIGHDGEGFCFDNEQPVHETLLRPYRLEPGSGRQGPRPPAPTSASWAMMATLFGPGQAGRASRFGGDGPFGPCPALRPKHRPPAKAVPGERRADCSQRLPSPLSRATTQGLLSSASSCETR